MDDDVWTETCGLALSWKHASRFWRNAYGGSDDPRPRGTHAPGSRPADWWAATQSFFGETAKNVEIGGLGFGNETHVTPGTAGHNSDDSVWWASSRCPDGLAVHTLTVGFPYDQVAASHFRPVFRAYVEDVAERRGCTDVTFPGRDEFTDKDH